MDWTSAPIIEEAPLEPAHQSILPARIGHFPARVEAFLEREREQLPLWFTAAFGAGILVLLRSRSGDFVHDLMSEASAYDGDPLPLVKQCFARCSRDACIADIVEGGHAWRLLAIRSRNQIDWVTTRACADADIVVADRWLPKGCVPRWLKLDRQALERTGGVAIYLREEPRVESVTARLGAHPWRSAATQPTATPLARFPTGR